MVLKTGVASNNVLVSAQPLTTTFKAGTNFGSV